MISTSGADPGFKLKGGKEVGWLGTGKILPAEWGEKVSVK